VNKRETIRSDKTIRYVIKSKKGNYLTGNNGWAKKLKNAFKFTSYSDANYTKCKYYKICKIATVKIHWLHTVEEIGEVERKLTLIMHADAWQKIITN